VPLRPRSVGLTRGADGAAADGLEWSTHHVWGYTEVAPVAPRAGAGARLSESSSGRERQVCTLVRVLSYVLARPWPTRGAQTLGQMKGAAAARWFPLLCMKALLLPHAMATSPGISWDAPGAPLRAGLGHFFLATLSALLLAKARPLQVVPPLRSATPMLVGLQPCLRKM